jgi:SAM-dependent methyltransferase
MQVMQIKHDSLQSQRYHPDFRFRIQESCHMLNFETYAPYYDLLYKDKDYVAEASYLSATIRQFQPHAGTILELGSGTGTHGRILASLGFDVHGVERSKEMVSIAKSVQAKAISSIDGSFDCEIGDLREVRLNKVFDVVVALFHVVSYQVENTDLEKAFKVAANHLAEGGLFLFDVWHGPAVLTLRPLKREKTAEDSNHKITRIAVPELDTNSSTVRVLYNCEAVDFEERKVTNFSEEHLMRYLFPTEIESLARHAGFAVRQFEEFLTGSPASPETWGVMYILRKVNSTEAPV